MRITHTRLLIIIGLALLVLWARQGFSQERGAPPTPTNVAKDKTSPDMLILSYPITMDGVCADPANQSVLIKMPSGPVFHVYRKIELDEAYAQMLPRMVALHDKIVELGCLVNYRANLITKVSAKIDPDTNRSYRIRHEELRTEIKADIRELIQDDIKNIQADMKKVGDENSEKYKQLAAMQKQLEKHDHDKLFEKQFDDYRKIQEEQIRKLADAASKHMEMPSRSQIIYGRPVAALDDHLLTAMMQTGRGLNINPLLLGDMEYSMQFLSSWDKE